MKVYGGDFKHSYRLPLGSHVICTPVQLFVYANIRSANHMAATQCIQACRHSQDDLLKFKPSIRMGKKDYLSDFERGMVYSSLEIHASIYISAKLKKVPICTNHCRFEH